MSRHALDYRAIFCMGIMTERGERPKNFGQHPPRGNGKEITTPRDVLIEQWRNAPEKLVKYRAGEVRDSEGNVLYEYSKGARLVILGEEVMDSCQEPWARATVDQAFQTMGSKKNLDVMERGFGMGRIASAIVENLIPRGGTYTVIELNKQVAEYAREWKKNYKESIANMGSPMAPNPGPQISMSIIEGDAVEETKKLAAIGKKYDIIISDTFPLSQDERSVNDLLDLDTLVKLLNPDGVFAFFGFHTGYQGGMNEKQANLVQGHFDTVNRTIVKGINPPPDYKYFNPEGGPIVRELPVIICSKPRLQIAA